MSEIKIELLKKEEIGKFYPVFSKVLSTGFPGYTKKVVDYFLNRMYPVWAFAGWIERGQRKVLVAKVNDKIVGFAILDSAYGGVSFCRWFGILAEFRKKGIGRKLLEKWEEEAKKEGCHKMEVAAQENAKDFYKRCGLVLEGKRDKSYFGIDQYIFGKVIGTPDDEKMVTPNSL